MGEFSYMVPPRAAEATEVVLDGVKRMLERMRVQEVPKDPIEARAHKLALAAAVNALCRGEWQR
jgi:hypothetical protein